MIWREVLVERTGPVLVISINRPQQRNAMTKEASRAIAEALDELDASVEFSVGILTGVGGTFCSGMDLKHFRSGEVASIPDRGFGGLTELLPRKPLIAAVEGYALAGGFELALACDLIVAARSACFGLPEVRRGLVARSGGLLRLPRLIPRPIALELILTGAMLGAERAYELGLVNRIVNDGDALGESKQLAAEISRGAPLAAAASKRIVDESIDWSPADWASRQQALSDPIFASDDAREGAAAFAEKREPIWRGQ